MKAKILVDELKDRTKRAAGISPTKAVILSTQNLLLDVQNDELIITATDLVNTIVISCPGKTEVNGSCTVPGKKFSQYIASLPKGEVLELEFDEERGRLNVKCANINSSLVTLPANEFPITPFVPDDVPVFEIEPDEFIEALEFVSIAAASDESRPIYTGINFKSNFDSTTDINTITMTATDGFRLSMYEFRTATKFDFDLTIPVAGINEVVKLSKKYPNEPIRIQVFETSPDKKIIAFEIGESEFSTMPIQGEFANGKKIISGLTNKQNVANVKLTKAEIEKALSSAGVFTSDNDKVDLALTIADDDLADMLKIMAESEDAGDVVANISCQVVDYRHDFLIGINVKYLVSLLKAIKEPVFNMMVTVEDNEQTLSPIVFRTANENQIALIMPMHVKK